MKAIWRQILALVGLGALVAVCSIVWGQERAAFKDRDLVVESAHNNPDRFVAILEANLDQATVDILGPLFLPEPSDAQKRSGLDDLEKEVRRLQLTVGNPVLDAIQAVRDGLTPPEVVEGSEVAPE